MICGKTSGKSLDSIQSVFQKENEPGENRLCQLWFQKINCSLNNLSSD